MSWSLAGKFMFDLFSCKSGSVNSLNLTELNPMLTAWAVNLSKDNGYGESRENILSFAEEPKSVFTLLIIPCRE